MCPALHLQPKAPPGPLAPRTWALIRYVGRPVGEVYPVPLGGLDFGRSESCAIRLPDPEVSRLHARIEVAPDGRCLGFLDLGSTNGIFVNGRRVESRSHPHPVLEGDVVRVAGHAFKVKRLDELEWSFLQASSGPGGIDALTRVSGRRMTLGQLDALSDAHRQTGQPLSLILLDLDGMGALNAAQGLQVGDAALAAVGSMLGRHLSSLGPVGRLGGDEFLALLPGLALPAARGIAEGLRTIVRDLQPTEGLLLGASLGVAEQKQGDEGGGPMLARADAALHLAKAGGGNAVAASP